jgi:hypothetical protein
MRTVRKIIEDAGGPAIVAYAVAEVGGKEIGIDAVYKWQHNGIPDRYWSAIIPLAGVTADEIFAANELARSEKVS